MTRFISLISGKGGAGKTTAALNIGHALTALGKKTLLLDANLMTPNVGINLGFINPEGTVNKFIRKEKTISESTYLHQSGLSFIPASPSLAEFQKTNFYKLSEVFEHLDDTLDFVLVDAPSGLGHELSQVLKNSDEAIVVVNPNLSSVIDSLKTIEMAKSYNNIIAGLILNMSHRGRNELKPEEIESLLGHQIIADVRQDRKIRKSLHRKGILSHLYPHSRTAKQFRKVAEHLCLEPGSAGR